MNEARMKMELHKVLREIQIHGTEYAFFRKKVDKYGEPTKEEPEQIANVKGLFLHFPDFPTTLKYQPNYCHLTPTPMKCLLLCYTLVCCSFLLPCICFRL